MIFNECFKNGRNCILRGKMHSTLLQYHIVTAAKLAILVAHYCYTVVEDSVSDLIYLPR